MLDSVFQDEAREVRQVTGTVEGRNLETMENRWKLKTVNKKV